MHVEEQLRPTRDTHERITSAIELAGERDARYAGSPELIAHLARQAEADATAVDPRQIVPDGPVRRLGLLLVPMLVLWVFLAFWMSPQRILRPMFHLLMPWKTAPAALSKVAVLPGDVTLAEWDDLEIRAHVQPEAFSAKGAQVGRATLVMRDAAGQQTMSDLARLGARDFHIAMPAVRKTFQYQITTDDGDSAWYTATVNARPAVEQLDLRYDFPAYTGLSPKIESGNDEGAIDALQRTKVTVTIHCATPLRPESKIVVTDKLAGGKPEPHDVAITATHDKDGNPVAGVYEAQLVVMNSATYSIQLVNTFGLANRDDRPRSITARFDEKPTIAITWPAAEITVRPDDSVPIGFQAADDFGIASIEAMIQVEGADAARPFAVPLGNGDKHMIAGEWPLSVSAIVAKAKLPDAARITYWLKATDNRDPDPQSAESAKQTLRIDRNADSVAAQVDAKKSKDIREAIRRAIEELDSERRTIDHYQWDGNGRALSTDELQNLDILKDKVEKTSSDLSAAADLFLHGPYAGIARKAKEIAENGIATAAGQVVRVQLHGEALDVRGPDAKLAFHSMTDAKTRLEKLLEEEQKLAQAIEAQHKLEEIARDQQKLADQAAQAQPNQPPDPSKQQQLAQKLQDVINRTPPLQDAKAARDARELAQLVDKVNELEKQQQQQEQQTQKQAQVADVQNQAKDLAQKQEDLNKKIDEFRKDDKATLDKASAQPPTQQQQQNIVGELNKNELAQATNEQKQSAHQLEDAANRLDQKANDNNLQPGPKQNEELTKRQNDAQAAHQDADQSKQQAQQADNAKKNVDHAAQEAKQAAADAAKPADQKKNAAQQAAQAADQAAQVAHQAAQQAKATEKKADAAAADAQADVRQAAKQSGEEAKQAEAAADQAQQAAKDAHAAADAGDAAQAAAKAEEAADDAHQAAAKAQDAAQQLADAQAKGLEATKHAMLDQQKEQSKQAAAQAHDLAKQQDALAKATEPKAAELQQARQDGALPAQAAAQQQTDVANRTKETEAAADRVEKQTAEDGNAEIAKRVEAAQQDLKQAEAAQKEAAKETAEGKPQEAAGAQEKAENALARAEQALRGLMPAPDAAMAKADGVKPDAAAEAAKADGDPAAGEKPAAEGQGGEAQAHAAEPHPGEAGQPAAPAQAAADAKAAAQEAARAAQEAAQAQQQAMQGKGQASQEAAQAAAQAAQALAQANKGQAGEPGQPGEPGTEPGQDGQPSPVAGQAADPKNGIQASLGGGSDTRPPSVLELGVSSSDWAKLGPLQQRDLANAAQQSGPPGYQGMIKNYYVRLARMQAQAGASR